MATKVKIKRSTTSNAPSALEFGEIAFSDGDNKLHIGKNNSTVHTFSMGSGLTVADISDGDLIEWDATNGVFVVAAAIDGGTY